MRSFRRALTIPSLGQIRPVHYSCLLQPSTAHKLFLLAAMYLSQTIPVGFIMGSLPVIMRAAGMSLQEIGFLFMLHLPWAFKFVHASYVDSHQIKKLGRRRSWILPMQWLTVLLFAMLSQTPPEKNLLIMFAICLSAALAMATNDIAVDGYATDMLSAQERPWGNAIQSGARSVGMVFGGGIPLFFYESLGWQATCLVLSGALLLLNLPVLFHKEMPPLAKPESGMGRAPDAAAGLGALLKKPDTRWLIALLIMPSLFYFLGFQMRLPLLNDLGLSPQSMGLAMIWCGAPGGILGSLLGGFLFHRYGPLPLMRGYVLAALGLGGFTIFLTGQAEVTQSCGLLILALDNLLLGIVHVWCFTLMMKASVGSQSGTSFALFSSVFLFPPLLLAPLSGAFGDAFGFGPLYSLLSGLLVLGFWGARTIARYRLQAFFKPEDF